MSSINIVIIPDRCQNELAVGTKVKVVDSYAESSESQSAPHTAAIGWTRFVLKHIEGANYPYLFGNENGEATGWAKASSLTPV